ncbi:MAG: MarR family transcriptional regulator [Actinomycetota bacterium]|nr:MarR family transcriptional regulator [Actinomycetota bacterium]
MGSFYERVLDAVAKGGAPLAEATAEAVGRAVAAAATGEPATLATLRADFERVRRRATASSTTTPCVDVVLAVVGQLTESLATARTTAVMHELTATRRREAGILRDRVLAALATNLRRPRDLVEILGCDASQVSRALRDLEDLGLVERVPGPPGTDRRARWYGPVPPDPHPEARPAIVQNDLRRLPVPRRGLVDLLSTEHQMLAELYPRRRMTLTELAHAAGVETEAAREILVALESVGLVHAKRAEAFDLTTEGESELARLATVGFFITLAQIEQDIPADFDGVVAIAGPSGSGKRQIAHTLAVRRVWANASIGGYIASLAARRRGPAKRLAPDDFTASLIGKVGWERLLDDVIRSTGASHRSGRIVIDGFRQPESLEVLEDLYGPERVISIGLRAPAWMRRARLREEMKEAESDRVSEDASEATEATLSLVDSAKDVAGLPLRSSRLRIAA